MVASPVFEAILNKGGGFADDADIKHGAVTFAGDRPRTQREFFLKRQLIPGSPGPHTPPGGAVGSFSGKRHHESDESYESGWGCEFDSESLVGGLEFMGTGQGDCHPSEAPVPLNDREVPPRD